MKIRTNSIITTTRSGLVLWLMLVLSGQFVGHAHPALDVGDKGRLVRDAEAADEDRQEVRGDFRRDELDLESFTDVVVDGDIVADALEVSDALLREKLDGVRVLRAKRDELVHDACLELERSLRSGHVRFVGLFVRACCKTLV